MAAENVGLVQLLTAAGAEQESRFAVADELNQQFRHVVLISRTAKDRIAMNRYLREEAEQVESTLEEAPLDALLLNLVASSDAANAEELRTFLRTSFFGSRTSDKNPKLLQARLDAVPAITKQLTKDGFILLSSDGRYRATSLGYVTSQKGITPQTALAIIRRARILGEKLAKSGIAEFSTVAEQLVPATIHLLLDADGESGPIYRDGAAAAFLAAHRQTVCGLRGYEDPSDPLLILQVAWVLSEWIKGTGYQSLCNPFRSLREGQIRQAAEHCSWMFDAGAGIAIALGKAWKGRNRR
jgi:replicative superfamily II helicase